MSQGFWKSMFLFMCLFIREFFTHFEIRKMLPSQWRRNFQSPSVHIFSCDNFHMKFLSNHWPWETSNKTKWTLNTVKKMATVYTISASYVAPIFEIKLRESKESSALQYDHQWFTKCDLELQLFIDSVPLTAFSCWVSNAGGQSTFTDCKTKYMQM